MLAASAPNALRFAAFDPGRAVTRHVSNDREVSDSSTFPSGSAFVAGALALV
jgi:hypothetical protein